MPGGMYFPAPGVDPVATAAWGALGEGLGSYLGMHYAQKGLDKVSNDPKYQQASPGEKLGMLGREMAKHGHSGAKLYETMMNAEMVDIERGKIAASLAKAQAKAGANALQEMGAGLAEIAAKKNYPPIVGQMIQHSMQTSTKGGQTELTKQYMDALLTDSPIFGFTPQASSSNIPSTAETIPPQPMPTGKMGQATQQTSPPQPFQAQQQPGVSPQQPMSVPTQPSAATQAPSTEESQPTEGFQWPKLEDIQSKRQGTHRLRKEKVKEEDDRAKFNLGVYEESKKHVVHNDNDYATLKQMWELNRTGKLPEGIKGAWNVDPVSGEVRFQGLANEETLLFQRALNSFISRAKDYYGSRVTNFDLATFMKGLPSLAATKEGRAAVIKSMLITNEIARLREQATVDTFTHYGPKVLDITEVRDIADRKNADRINELENNLIHMNKVIAKKTKA